jgi:SAM-dependent methyltransferase
MPTFSCKADEIARMLEAVQTNHRQSAKEVVRHLMHQTGMIGLLDRRRKRRGLNTADLLSADAESTFKKTYSTGGWVHYEGQESSSGVGSSVEATRGLFDAIQSVMAEIGANSLVDVGCGDWNWMRHQNIKVDYTGVDIVPDVILQNQQYSRVNVRFEVLNAINEPPPPADMALAREVIFHLSFSDGKAMLRNLATSTDYVCATTNADVLFNSDIRTGDFRSLNLMKHPFNLPRPIALIDDMAVSHGRFLAVWPKTSVLMALR